MLGQAKISLLLGPIGLLSSFVVGAQETDAAKIVKGDVIRLRTDRPGFTRLGDDQRACGYGGTRLDVVHAEANSIRVEPLGVPEKPTSDVGCDKDDGSKLPPLERGELYNIDLKGLPDGTFRRSGFTHGPLFVPFKRRFSDKVLSGEGNLGYFLGYEVGEIRGFSVVPIGSIGISLVNLNNNSASTTNSTRGDSGVQAAFTYSVGLVLKTFDKFQLGLVLGHDRIGGEAGANWKYENKWWMSFAFGYEFVR
jgi:hypothetical protein